ncbi:MAG TPA: triose-phosphate isomerase [Vicinamibacterales bacterium]
MRRPIVVANWKMHKTVHETVVFVKELRQLVKDVHDAEIVVAPPFTSLHAAMEAARASNIAVAAQDVYFEKEGAFTGAVSADMVKEAGAEFAIVGHSERRRVFGDTDEIVNRKARAADAAGLTPIICIGETLEERERNETMSVLDGQIKAALDGFTGDHIAGFVIAYEPVWAIGTGRNASAEQAGEAHAHIRQRLRSWFGAAAAEGCHILYGGSVKPDNVAAIAAQPEVDGALVGGASLDSAAFYEIVRHSGRERRAVPR